MKNNEELDKLLLSMTPEDIRTLKELADKHVEQESDVPTVEHMADSEVPSDPDWEF